MLNSTVLDVVIGLVLIFVILSVACSVLNERIQTVLEKRSTMLEAAIRKLLAGDASIADADPASGLFNSVVQHALVRAIALPKMRLPSYLPSSTFALALFDTLVPANGGPPMTVERLRKAIALLPASAGKDSLLAVLNTAEYDIPNARAAVERWFDSAMERMSGAYKRHINRWIFALGFGVAAAVNADAIQLIHRLQNEQVLRTRVLAQATKAVEQGAPPSPGTGLGTTKLDTTKLDITGLDTMDLLFWDTTQMVSAEGAALHPRALRAPELSGSWLLWMWLKIIGFVITALAVTLGAPFWFDLLNRLVNLRATGAKPAKAPPENG